MDVHCALGMALFHLGEVRSARTQLEQAWSLAGPSQDHPHACLFPIRKPGVHCAAFLIHVYWFLGCLDQASSRMAELALSFIEQLDPADLGCAHFLMAAFYQLSGQVRESQEYAQSAVLLSNEFGSGQWGAKAGVIRGWALAAQGQEEGIEQIKQNLSTLSQTGPHLARHYYLSLLAQAYGCDGQAEKGLSTLNEALAIMRRLASTSGRQIWFGFWGICISLSMIEIRGCLRRGIVVW